MGDQTARMVDLPGDVLFASGQIQLASDGKAILDKLFGDADSGVLSFDQGGLAQRKLVIHGHTDDVGLKDANFQLGYQRAYAVYQEIRRHSKEVPDHVILCTHADNTPARAVPPPPIERSETGGGAPDGSAGGAGSRAPRGIDRAVADEARAKNRRITIEDLVVAGKPDEAGPRPAPETR
jgi:outer membrane protein OmpA-like peptidoglycan-associated protein